MAGPVYEKGIHFWEPGKRVDIPQHRRNRLYTTVNFREIKDRYVEESSWKKHNRGEMPTRWSFEHLGERALESGVCWRSK